MQKAPGSIALRRFFIWGDECGLGLQRTLHMLTVVAAMIEFEGRLLVCQRRRGDSFELMWEFPGGKVEPGETLEKALARELREELGVTASIGPEILRLQHVHPGRNEPFELVFFSARVSSGEVTNYVFERIEWRVPQKLPELDFLPADRDLVEKLASGAIRVRSGNVD